MTEPYATARAREVNAMLSGTSHRAVVKKDEKTGNFFVKIEDAPYVRNFDTKQNETHLHE